MPNKVHPKVVEAGRLLSVDGDIETAMDLLAEFFDEDAQRSTHPAVVDLLTNCRDAARAISFEWYASLK